MNKMLELIEAQKLFGIPNHKIDILIHPNSLVHAVIMLKNGLMHYLSWNNNVDSIGQHIFEKNLNIKNFTI